MKRWFWKRWVWAVLVGTTATVGISLAQGGKDNQPWPPKVGDTITLPFEEGPQQFKVLKIDKQPDGSFLCELKDTRTGKTINYLEQPPGAAAKPGSPAPPPAGSQPKAQPPKAQPRYNDPLLPSVKDAMSGADKDSDKDKGRLLPFLNSSKDKTTTSQKPEEERPGLLKRLFGRKKPEPQPTAMPAATMKPTTTLRPTAPAAMPPPVRPNPVITGNTPEPPRSIPIRPVTPPAAAIPAPPPIPAAPPATRPAPLPLPTAPVVPPAGSPAPGGLPPIPIPPNGVSAAPPAAPARVAIHSPVTPPAMRPSREQPAAPAAQPVVPAGRAVVSSSTPAAQPALPTDLRPHAEVLKDGLAPSSRALAARAMSGGRHGSTETVKRMLFDAAQHDPCPMVRAVCIEELCKLGYYDPAFMAFVEKACDDKSDEVKAAAKAAAAQMTSRK